MLRIKVDRWSPSKFKELGRGGEAVIYKLRPDTVAKVFLKPDALEFKDNAGAQEAARVRIREMQTKLFDFPRDFPPNLIAPNGVLMDLRRAVFGYTMPFVEGTSLDKLGKTSSILTPHLTSKLLIDLHDLVSGIHAKGGVIGDFNENNIIVSKDFIPALVDADSMQFGKYLCRSFMPRFVAPEIIEMEGVKKTRRRRKEVVFGEVYYPPEPKPEAKPEPVGLLPQFAMIAPHSTLTDWYSYLVIAMRLTTFTDPYGGVLKDMDLGTRIQKRITVFNPKVLYPRVARPLRELPRSILEVFFQVFQRGQRFVPDRNLFDVLNAPMRFNARVINSPKTRTRKEPVY